MYAWQFAKAQYIAEKNGWTKFIAMQNHYNVICNINCKNDMLFSLAFVSRRRT
jgi:hypothetical protein